MWRQSLVVELLHLLVGTGSELPDEFNNGLEIGVEIAESFDFSDDHKDGAGTQQVAVADLGKSESGVLANKVDGGVAGEDEGCLLTGGVEEMLGDAGKCADGGIDSIREI